MFPPGYLREQRGPAARPVAGPPAEVEYRYAVGSTDRPLESARILCPRGHRFNGPVETLIWHKRQGAAAPGARSQGGSDEHPAR